MNLKKRKKKSREDEWERKNKKKVFEKVTRRELMEKGQQLHKMKNKIRQKYIEKKKWKS